MSVEKPPLQIEVSREGDLVVCRLVGSANMETCQRLNQKLAEAGEQADTVLAIDLSELDFICSLGLGAIVAAYLRARRAGIGIRLVSPRPEIRDLLTLTKLETLLPVFDTIGDPRPGPR